MIFFTALSVRLRWFNSAAGILVVLLQRTPVVRTFITAESVLAAPAASLLRSMLPAAAALGAVHSMAGASTQLVGSVNQPAKATVGVPFAEAITIQGTGVSFAQSWAIGNTLPPGIVAQGATLQSGRLVINPSSGTLLFTGTPTTAGTYNISVSGYQYTNLTGPVTTATAQIVVAAAPNAAPVLTRQPSNVTAVVGGSATLSITYTGTPAPTFQWLKNGVPIVGATSSTLVLTAVSPTDAGSYTVTLTNSLGTVTSAAATITVNAAPTAPVFTTAPVSQTATVGGNVSFTVAVTGVPTPTLQWLKNGSGIDSATDATFTLTSVQPADAGVYSVAATNSIGNVTSATATLVVAPAATAPVFLSPPASQTVTVGSTVVFSAPALGTPTPSYQWQHNGANVAGATGATLMLINVAAADAGSYVCIAANSLGTASSTAAALVVSATADVTRLSNLSILTDITTDVPSFTVGTVVGGGGTSGTKPLLVRAAGPSLAALGVQGTLANPQLALLTGQTVIATDSKWGGTATLKAAIAQVGAFPYLSDTSSDAAIYLPTLAAGSYTVQVSGGGGATGTVIAELYDANPASTFTAATPRLVDVSVLKQISAGGSMTLGFTIGGSTAKTVLIRAIGPSLGLPPFGIAGAMADPQLTLYDSTSTIIAANDNWGGDPQLTAAGARAGAFAILGGATSKDSALLITLPPGGYTATASGVGGIGGLAIVEVYEVP